MFSFWLERKSTEVLEGVEEELIWEGGGRGLQGRVSAPSHHHHHRFVAGCLDSGHTDRSKSDWTLVTYRLTKWDIEVMTRRASFCF